MGQKLQTQDDIQRLLWRFAEHRVVTVAGRTGILAALAASPQTVDSLAETLGLEAMATGKLVRALSALGMVESDGQAYSIPATLRVLFQPGAADLGPFLEHAHILYEQWGDNLESWVRGESWPTSPASPEGAEKFGRAMSAMGSGVAQQVIAALGEGAVSTLLDVGGGLGHYAKAFIARHPALRATVMDVATVIEIGRRDIAETPLRHQLAFKAGSYRDDDWGTGYDLVLLANILHQEDASMAAAMVQRAAAATSPGGRVVVVDFSIDDPKCAAVIGTLFALNMRSFGDTYSEPEIRQWMSNAGLGQCHRVDISDFRWVMVGQKAF